MPPPAILDPSELDLTKVCATREDIQRVNPHRHEFSLLDAVVLIDRGRRIFAGYHDVQPDAWWVRAHVPGRPLFPGVLMIEVAAQLCSFLAPQYVDRGGFLALSRVDDVIIREAVVPPARLVVIGRMVEARSRRVRSANQGFVGNTMVFEAVISGLFI